MKRSEQTLVGRSEYRRIWIGGLSVATVMLVAALPYGLSAYHLQAGGQALERALGWHDALEWWYVGPREVVDPQALRTAIAHLEQARRAPYALRLLGQAYVAQGDTLSGVRALEQFVKRRPKHYLAQLELAAAYAYADERLHELEYLDLLGHLEGARISVPDRAGQTRYSSEDWQNDYVYPTAFSLPPEYGDRPTLFVHAGAQVTWTVMLSQPCVLRFGMGLSPRSLGWGGDGATFEVFAGGQRLFLEHLPVEQAREGWHERDVDLSAYVGQTIALSLSTTPGPTDDVTGDWAGWGEPRLEDGEAFAYRQTVKSQPWQAKWRGLGVTAQDWIKAGEIARQEKKFETAEAWYGWADLLSAGKGDVWYNRGQLYEDQERWVKALDAYKRATEADGLADVPCSSPYYRIGVIYQRRIQPRQPEAALKAYKTAIKKDAFASHWEQADCAYKIGELYDQLGRDPGLSMLQYHSAIELYPGHYWAHLRLGQALYQAYGDVALAERRIEQASALWPDDPSRKWPFRVLGDIYWDAGMLVQASAAYQEALRLDPSDDYVSTQLQELDALRSKSSG